MKKRCALIIKQKRIKFGRAFLAFVVAFLVSFGILGGKLTKAFEGDYWTVTNEDGLSITIVSVSQYGIDLVPIDDGNDGYYFATNNNTDAVTVGLRVNGMQQGTSYYYYAMSDYTDRRDLTSENNGQLIYEELKPHVYFQDEDSCHGSCYTDPWSGIYYVGPNINKVGGYGTQKNLAIRPASLGSQNIDIISVKQNDTNLTLLNNEYQIVDYDTPAEVTFKLKNLVIGEYYDVEVGRSDYYRFRAEATEVTETRELELDLVTRHTNASIYLYGSGGYEQVMLYFKVADEHFAPLGDIIIDEIEQGGVALPYEANTSGYRREYTFSANDAQGIVVRMHTTLATADMNYYILFNMYGGMDGYSSDEPFMATGEALEREGIVLSIPPAFGMSDSSPFTLSFYVNTTGSRAYGYNQQRVIFKDYANPQNDSDDFKFNFSVDENVPRYDAAMYYSDGTRIESDTINPLYHDDEHPLLLEITGENYDSGRTYNIDAKVKVNGEAYYSEMLTATGAELNDGTVFRLDDLTLDLPEFDPSGETSGYELYYEFSLEIDGLRQSGVMYYSYDGWLKSSMTYNNGEVVAVGGGGAVGGDMYSTINEATIRKSSLDGSRGATLHYLASGFDESLSYDFTVYYNGNAGHDWWTAPAGNSIENGVMPGNYLNSEGLSINVVTPSNESESVLYTLVITRNGKLVALAKDFICFTNEPKIESFKFTADSDSFMQTDRTSYRAAIDTDIDATLTGGGFESETEYKLWVGYSGYRFRDEGEGGYGYPEYVDLSELNESIVVTGAQLNAGYTYDLDYLETFDGINSVEVGFIVSDMNVDGVNWHGENGSGTYFGHSIYIDYVNDDEVFHDNGYQVNEDGTITDVSQPDEHGDIPVDIRTPGDVDVIVEDETLTVVSRKPTLVIGHKNSGYVLIEPDNSIDNDGEKTNIYNISGYDEIKVVLKGDGTFDGNVTSADSNLINRALISSALPMYRQLSDLERIVFDVTGDGNVTSADSNRVNRSLISHSLPTYKALEW